MKVFATTAISPKEVETYLPVFHKLAAQDRFRVHTLVEDPDSADIVLFLDGHQHYRDLNLTDIREHPIVRRNRDRAFVYNEMDQPWCAMPGLYVSMPKNSFDWQRQRPCSYLVLINNTASQSTDDAPAPNILFSYMGRLGHPVRKAIMQIREQRSVIEDTSHLSFFGANTDAVAGQKRRYAEVIQRSKFVLCPVGSGPSSFRLFETMAAGRVPVIISDAWTRPIGPAWSDFSLSVPERRIRDLPKFIASQEPRFPEMAKAARLAWEEWFSPEVLFHRMVESCKDIMEKRSSPAASRPQTMNVRYLRLRARGWKHELKAYLSQTLRGSVNTPLA